MTCAVAHQTLRFNGCARVFSLDTPTTCDDLLDIAPQVPCTMASQVAFQEDRVDSREEQSSPKWGSARYFDTIAPRLVTLLELAESDTPLHIRGFFALDSDVSLQRNVAARAEHMGADFVFQRELPCERRETCINAGVWWFAARSDNVRRVLQNAVRLMRLLSLPDQDALQEALVTDPTATVAFFDSQTHPNGFSYSFDDRVFANSALHLVHANWATTRLTKLARLADIGALEPSHCFSKRSRQLVSELESHRNVTRRVNIASRRAMVPIDTIHYVADSQTVSIQHSHLNCDWLDYSWFEALDCPYGDLQCVLCTSTALRKICRWDTDERRLLRACKVSRLANVAYNDVDSSVSRVLVHPLLAFSHSILGTIGSSVVCYIMNLIGAQGDNR